MDEARVNDFGRALERLDYFSESDIDDLCTSVRNEPRETLLGTLGKFVRDEEQADYVMVNILTRVMTGTFDAFVCVILLSSPFSHARWNRIFERVHEKRTHAQGGGEDYLSRLFDGQTRPGR